MLCSGLVTAALAYWVNESVKSAKTGNGPSHVLKLPMHFLAFGVVVTIMFLTLSVSSHMAAIDGNPTANALTTSVFGAFAGLGGILIAAYFIERFEVKYDGVKFRVLPFIQGHFTWAEVKSIDHSEFNRWFRINLYGGRTVRAQFMMKGMPVLARSLLHKVDHSKIEPNTFQLLAMAAFNRLPAF